MGSTCDNCGYESEWTMEMNDAGEILCDRCMEKWNQYLKDENDEYGA